MQTCKLIMVSDQNNNKFIEMNQVSDTMFEVFTGRIDVNRISQGKQHIERWDSYYKSKIRKGYVDVTSSEEIVQSQFKTIDNPAHRFLEWLQSASKLKVFDTYKISTSQVTQAQIDIVSNLLDDLSKVNLSSEANQILLKIYTYLPRRMGNVKDHLLSDLSSLQAKIDEERDNLNSITSQVVISQDKKESTLADAIGIAINEPTADDISRVKTLLGDNSFTELYSIDTSRQLPDKSKSLLWHGSQVSNWISILRIGLKIYPTATNGRKYGNGIYFANDINKSLQYGSNVLGLFEVVTGNQYVTSHSNGLPPGYDSLHIKAHYDEIIVFNESQAVIRYIVRI